MQAQLAELRASNDYGSPLSAEPPPADVVGATLTALEQGFEPAYLDEIRAACAAWDPAQAARSLLRDGPLVEVVSGRS